MDVAVRRGRLHSSRCHRRRFGPLGLLLAVAGLTLALSGSLTMHRQRGATGVIFDYGDLSKIVAANGGHWGRVLR